MPSTTADRSHTGPEERLPRSSHSSAPSERSRPGVSPWSATDSVQAQALASPGSATASQGGSSPSGSSSVGGSASGSEAVMR